MSTLTNRTPKGVPSGGQFAADLHGEPTTTLTPQEEPAPSDPQVLRNLNRSIVQIPEITEEQKSRLRRGKTPLLDAFKRKGVPVPAPAAKAAPRIEESAA